MNVEQVMYVHSVRNVHSVGKISTFYNRAICNIFGLRYYKLLGLLRVAIQIFPRSNLDSGFSKVFREAEGKM